jgi:hypothetical protein
MQRRAWSRHGDPAGMRHAELERMAEVMLCDESDTDCE